MRISINCPSFKRPLVKTYNIYKKIKIWVSPKDYSVYKKENKNYNLIKCPEGIQGHGKSRILNYILKQEFKNNDIVVFMDDDIRFFGYYEKEVNIGIKEKQFYDFIEKYSLLAMEMGVKYWGVNLNDDKKTYREYTPFSLKSVILGPFNVHLKHNLLYDENMGSKEDYDMAIQQLNKYRKILRINKYHYDCNITTSAVGNIGGWAMDRNIISETNYMNRLIKKWGSKIVRHDITNAFNIKKRKRFNDFNPIIKVPIKGI